MQEMVHHILENHLFVPFTIFSDRLRYYLYNRKSLIIAYLQKWEISPLVVGCHVHLHAHYSLQQTFVCKIIIYIDEKMKLEQE